MMRRKAIEIVLAAKGKNYFPLYDKFVEEKKEKLEILEQAQVTQLRKLIDYAGRYVPYYCEVFKKIGLESGDINSIKDIETIPILTKRDIVDNYDEFIPKIDKENWYPGATGGSTGQPLRYRISQSAMLRNAALLNRGFGYAGYRIGDKMATLAGGSLTKSTLSHYDRLNQWIHNKKSYSSYGLDEANLATMASELNKWRPAFLRGYATSLYLLARFLEDSKREKISSLKAVFSTAEMLSDKRRSKIEKVLGVKVYNQYGLNDSGITAFEDGIYPGMVVDTERSILEVVNPSGIQVTGEQGLIVGTSLYNYAFPFIRYDTNDLGELNLPPTQSEESRWRLSNLAGRVTDLLKVNGKTVGSPVLTVLMGKINALNYQIIQMNSNRLEIRIERGKDYSDTDEKTIRDSLTANLGKLDLKFVYDQGFKQSENKHKFIIKCTDSH